MEQLLFAYNATDADKKLINDFLSQISSDSYQIEEIKAEITAAENAILDIPDSYLKMEMNVRRDLMKLAIDLYKDYEYYKQFLFQTKYLTNSYNIGLKDLGYTFQCDKWCNPLLPALDIVLKNIFRYLVAFKSLKRRKGLSTLQCSFCDHPWKNNKSYCDKCDTDVMDMMSIHSLSCISDDELSTVSVQCQTMDISENNTPTGDFKSLSDTSENEEVEDFWTCSNNICRFNNSFKSEVCRYCKSKGPHFEKWLCERCHFINRPHDVVCSTCFNNNGFLQTCTNCKQFNINYKYEVVCTFCRHSGMEDWTCSKALEHFMYGETNKCKVCSRKPLKFPQINAVEDVSLNSSIVKMWKCTSCFVYNVTNDNECHFCLNIRYITGRILCCKCGIVNGIGETQCSRCRKKLT